MIQSRWRISAACALFGGLTFLARGSAFAADPKAVACVDATNDRPALTKSAGVAKRPARHMLTVAYKGALRHFADGKPYEDALGATHWYYCGPVPGLHAQLIGKNENDMFSGVLMRDDTGEVIAAGATVWPSPDGQRFLAEQQEDGEDGAQWRVAYRSGKTLWSGYAGVLQRSDATADGYAGSVIKAWYQDPYWTPDNTLHATAVCQNPSVPKTTVTLSQSRGGWHWEPVPACR